MRSRFARFLLILTALWLPLQAVAGMAMLRVCAHEAPAVSAAATDGEHCPYHDAAGGVPAVPDQSAGDDQGCTQCGVCHLAASGYMPAAEVVPGVVPDARCFVPLAAATPSSHIPEPLQHPPKRHAA
jgi:hypothetical protein